MKYIGVIVVVFLKILCSESRMLPINYVTINPNLYEPTSVRMRPQSAESEENPHEKVIGLREPYEEQDTEEYFDYDTQPSPTDTTSKPCAVVVLSNMQNPNMQSLLRKYRYDANGVLIPSSVKYFIKLPQGLRASPILVPLNDKAFSPLGGFVRYYKEVPPIPHAW
ncbi:uncharacterized protein LOC111354913 [Spodoptera litura]|uniref:Uncharacterized protein LOC111354913 n=1 Tax=Spodoptera litura TaxID=69820 RepID=A0A9J7ISK4_SPOLT|nr:uncharacterized protein LOC111354913 [Spodoptera litura]